MSTARPIAGWYRDPAYEGIIGSLMVTYSV